MNQMLAYPPEQSLMMGVAVLVGGLVLFIATVLAVRWAARRQR